MSFRTLASSSSAARAAAPASWRSTAAATELVIRPSSFASLPFSPPARLALSIAAYISLRAERVAAKRSGRGVGDGDGEGDREGEGDGDGEATRDALGRIVGEGLAGGLPAVSRNASRRPTAAAPRSDASRGPIDERRRRPRVTGRVPRR